MSIDTSTTPSSEPDGAPRIAVLDILRGLAILGILFMNINDMGASFRAGGDIRHFGWTSIDQVTWWTREILANGTARCLLEMLFGAGMVILTDRASLAAAERWEVLKRYYFRNIVLFLFGLVHVFILLWPGDILHTYGLAALVAFWFRRLAPRWLIAIGMIMGVLQLCLTAYFGVYRPLEQQRHVAAIEAKIADGQKVAAADRKVIDAAAKEQAEDKRYLAKRDAAVAKEDKDRSSTTARWIGEQTAMSVRRLFGTGELFAIWESASLMLIGAALFKLGILQGKRTRGFYVKLTIAAYIVGASLRTLGAYEETRFDELPHFSWATEEIARQAMTLGHVGLANWLVLGTVGSKLMRPFAAAGRTALTIYVLQTIICLWVLYPPFALGWYGTQGWGGLMLTALIINIALLALANWYIIHYRIAPVEWAWRSIVEGRRLPFRQAQDFRGE